MSLVGKSRLLRVIVAVLAGAPLSGCVVYEPVPAYYPGGSNFDRAWSAALGGTQDAGVQVTSAEPSTGLIRGTKDGIDVVVTVARQADGSVRVQFDSKGPTQKDPGLADRFSRAYDRRMGR
ncbi:MAG TPA: hypothetical protein VKF40_05135 [Burkholderiales bacterium]|nr:hypothetical protein [Burkholderiales bacterium]